MDRFIALASIGCLVSGVRGDEYAPVYQTGSEPVLQEAQDYYQPPASPVYYNRPQQDNFLDDGLGIIGLAGALGIGGLIGGFALIQQAAIAREQIRSQISADTAVANAINSLLPTQTAAITSLTTSQTTITNQATQLCATAAAVVAAIPTTIAEDDGDVETVINAVITAFMSNPCP
ncbi:hypothetical protein TCAL_10377 [Tigriopus californicus]|uniref:Uncharacterized protein n=1 Tax=Tigriopus californicus TaxID=6832 RepID=A0A553P6U9_TIGCA|nr:uncharacterized protein LOC131877820 [Tigriopus californicus]TRY73402.1 hypothetical protein TCAL_10377 [Tigriopus californicus]